MQWQAPCPSMALASNLSQANRLLAALPADVRAEVLAACERVELKAQSVVLQADDALMHAWFPVEGCVSLELPLKDARPLTVGLIGTEGLFPASIALGGTRSAFTSRTQGAGQAFRIERPALLPLLERRPPLRQVLQGYADVRHRQLARQAACVTHHGVEPRLARWLLMARDRAQASEFFLTHEALALMLGARRESVTQAARRMLLRGHISYSRGYMMLLDEAALAREACPCYQADLQAYESWWSALAQSLTTRSTNCSLATTGTASTKG